MEHIVMRQGPRLSVIIGNGGNFVSSAGVAVQIDDKLLKLKTVVDAIAARIEKA